jgi:hypothetical protein
VSPVHSLSPRPATTSLVADVRIAGKITFVVLRARRCASMCFRARALVSRATRDQRPAAPEQDDAAGDCDRDAADVEVPVAVVPAQHVPQEPTEDRAPQPMRIVATMDRNPCRASISSPAAREQAQQNPGDAHRIASPRSSPRPVPTTRTRSAAGHVDRLDYLGCSCAQKRWYPERQSGGSGKPPCPDAGIEAGEREGDYDRCEERH